MALKVSPIFKDAKVDTAVLPSSDNPLGLPTQRDQDSINLNRLAGRVP